MGIFVLCAVPVVSAQEEGTDESQEESQQGEKQKPAKLDVGLRLKAFRAQRGRSIATGVAEASLRDGEGRVTTVKQKVRLRVAQNGGCRILFLNLEKLDLSLLGLNIHLDKVNLRITGRNRGGVLGRLFCKLSRADVKVSQRREAARALTARARKSRGRIMGFSTRVYPQATASQEQQTCQVLQLTLGPLDLDLLGLVVNLNQVKLNITATRGAGVLGDLFCQLADNNAGGEQQAAEPQASG
jgi:hypothetical protein